MSTSLHRPAGTLADRDLAVSLSPADAGWAYSGLLVILLAPGVERSIDLGDSEAVVLPLSATDVEVTIDGELVIAKVSPKGYEELGRMKVCKPTRQAPSLANGMLFLRDEEEIVCFDVPLDACCLRARTATGRREGGYVLVYLPRNRQENTR